MVNINYTPSPIIGEFIQHYLPGELFYAFVVGPFGSAKTTGALFKIAYMAQLQAPSLIDGIRRTRVVVVRNTAPQLKDNTLASWNYWFKDGVAGKRGGTEKKFLVKVGGGEGGGLFWALDTPEGINRVLGLEVKFAGIDEVVKKNAAI